MDRRRFVATGASGVVGLGLSSGAGPHPREDMQQSVRSAFPRLQDQVYVNGAAGTPLGAFAERGMRRYLDFAALGPGEGRDAYVGEVLDGVRGRFARLVGARESEIGLVHCTKAGEQLLVDHLPALRSGGNVVTNDLHFSGSLHNYEGLRRSGVDVRIVRAEGWDVPLERMADAIDERTALVAVSLVSNVNGRVERMAELAALAHARGAVVFADIIQAAGAVSVDLPALGVDVASCSSYKWLFGVHGAGFLFVRDGLQGSERLPDRLFPGHVARNYAPFVRVVDSGAEPYTYRPPADARRYQPGHVSYLGYAAVYEGLRFLEEIGVERIHGHAVRLNRRLLDALPEDDFERLTPDVEAAPILSVAARRFEAVASRLRASDVVVSLGGDVWNQVRISPAIYNTEEDMDRLAEVLLG